MADLHVAALPCKSTPGAQVAVHSQTVQTVEASRPVMPGRVPPRVPVRVPVHVRVPVPVPDSGSSYGRSVPALHSTPLTRVVVLVVQRTVPGTTYPLPAARNVQANPGAARGTLPMPRQASALQHCTSVVVRSGTVHSDQLYMAGLAPYDLPLAISAVEAPGLHISADSLMLLPLVALHQSHGVSLLAARCPPSLLG